MTKGPVRLYPIFCLRLGFQTDLVGWRKEDMVQHGIPIKRFRSTNRLSTMTPPKTVTEETSQDLQAAKALSLSRLRLATKSFPSYSKRENH